VAAQVSVTDAHLDSSSVQATLNGQPYVSGAEIAQLLLVEHVDGDVREVVAPGLDRKSVV